MNKAKCESQSNSIIKLTTKEIKESEMILGYIEGLASKEMAIPKGLKASASYKHGWLNGRDDRIGTPRDKEEVLQRRAKMILES